MENLYILCGLPGSGKTTWAEEKKKEFKETNKCFHREPDFAIFYFDDFKTNTPDTLIYKLQDICNKKDNVIFDGLFINQNAIFNIVSESYKLCNKKIKNIIIEYWEENKENCIINDMYRGDEDSKLTINNLSMGSINVDKLKEDLLKKFPSIGIESCTINYHKIAKKSIYQFYKDKFKIEDKVYSQKWIISGESWNISGESWREDPEESCAFIEFDNLLMKMCPNILYFEGKQLYRLTVSEEINEEHDYYSNITYGQYVCNIDKLIDYLIEKGYLNEHENFY